MTNIDAPDYQRAVVAADMVLGTFDAETASATVTLPPNVTAIWIVLGPPPTSPPGVVGVTTGADYPVYSQTTQAESGDPVTTTVAIVAPSADTQVTITWPTSPDRPWTVVGDTGGRWTADPSGGDTITQTGQPAPVSAVQVGGSDGTNLRTLLTDDTGKLQVTDATASEAIGVPGDATPGHAMFVAGTDGTDLRGLLTDDTGKLAVSGAEFPAAYAEPGQPIPTDALLVGGSYGGTMEALAVDAYGILETRDQTLDNCYGVPGDAAPSDAIQVAGTDDTDLRVILTDTAGRVETRDLYVGNASGTPGNAAPDNVVMVGTSDGSDARNLLSNKQGIPLVTPSVPNTATGDHPPNELQWATLNGISSNTDVLAAPGAGLRYRIFFIYAYPNNSAASYFVAVYNQGGTACLFCVNVVATGVYQSPAVIPLTGFVTETNSAVELAIGGGEAGCVIGYTLETV